MFFSKCILFNTSQNVPTNFHPRIIRRTNKTMMQNILFFKNM